MGPVDPSDAPLTARTGPAVDADVLAELTQQMGDGGGEMIAELIDTYLAEGAGQVASLVIATLSDDAESVASLARTLRSWSRLLGATGLADLLQQAEDVAHSGPADLVPLAGPIQSEFAQVSDELRVLRPPTSSTPDAAPPD